jgi:hypothetical protein
MNLQEEFENYIEIWKNESLINNFIYQTCKEKSEQNDLLNNHFNISQVENNMAFSELAFRHFWLLLINQLNHKSKVLEIGVYKGATLSLFKLVSDFLKKDLEIYGITPLNSTGDKYSNYQNLDYRLEIDKLNNLLGLKTDYLNLIVGLSIDEKIKDEIRKHSFDLIFIDGGHDFDTVINDIKISDEILKVGGFLITDDSSSDLNFPTNFIGFRGHAEVSLAINNSEIIKNKYRHLFACGHNRCWKKIK